METYGSIEGAANSKRAVPGAAQDSRKSPFAAKTIIAIGLVVCAVSAVGLVYTYGRSPFEINDSGSGYKPGSSSSPDTAGNWYTDSSLVKRILTSDEASKYGAACLDGSEPGFYIANTTDTEHSHHWVLYFKGGGWCFNATDCKSRSETDLGSSYYFPDTVGFSGGPLSPDSDMNPAFSNFNRVLLYYCDGSSFTGDREETVEVGDKQLYFRGKRNLDAILDVLMTQYGLDAATEVLVSGGSAGGLAAFQNADYIREKLSSPDKFKVMPLSAFFLWSKTEQGVLDFPSSVEAMVEFHNASHGLNERCAYAFGDDAWKCFFPSIVYGYVSTPTFIINSMLDSWQIDNILQFNSTDCSGWKGSYKYSQFTDCSSHDIKKLNTWARRFVSDLTRTDGYSRSGNGAYIDSCLEHVAAEYAGWHIYKQGQLNISMVDASQKWWDSYESKPVWHTYLPDFLSQDTPHQQNPTCKKTCNYCN